MKTIIKDERGVTSILEATIYLPVAILALLALLYATVFLTVQVNMQCALQDAIIYFKNQESDTYVTTKSEMSIKDTSEADYYEITHVLNPYRSVFMKFNDNSCVNFVKKIAGYMFFSDNVKMKVTAQRRNYFVCKKIMASSEISFTPVISIKKNDRRILRSSAVMVITDGDEIIRTLDFADDMTGFSDNIQNTLDKVTDIYRKFRDALLKD